MKIEVRPQKNDSTNVCTLCPVAQALLKAAGLPRATPADARRAICMAQPDRLNIQSHRLRYAGPTPPKVAEWIKRWDATGEGDPFDFELESNGVVLEGWPGQAWLFPGFEMIGGGPRV